WAKSVPPTAVPGWKLTATWPTSPFDRGGDRPKVSPLSLCLSTGAGDRPEVSPLSFMLFIQARGRPEVSRLKLAPCKQAWGLTSGLSPEVRCQQFLFLAVL